MKKRKKPRVLPFSTRLKVKVYFRLRVLLTHLTLFLLGIIVWNRQMRYELAKATKRIYQEGA